MSALSQYDRTSVGRRAVLAAGAAFGAAAGLSLLAGCSADPRSAEYELDFWHLLSGGDGLRMNSMLTEVNRELEGASVSQTLLAWGSPYYTKLAMASAGGRAPDLGIMHLSRLPGYAPGGLLDPWDIDRMAKYGVERSTFTAPTWERMQSSGGTFAIALDSHAFVRFFNPEVAEQAGVLDANGVLETTKSVDEFIDQAAAMSAVTDELGLSYGWLGSGDQMWRLFWTFYTQLGATMEIEGDRFRFDSDAFTLALETMKTILDSDAVNRRSDPGFAFSSFTSGQSGELLGGVWELVGIQNSGIPLDASPIPNLFGTGIDAVWGDSHAFVLPHQSSIDEQRREKTYEAVALTLKASLQWAGAGHTPAFQPVVAEEEFATLQPNANYSETATYLQYDPVLPFAGSGSNWQVSFGQSVQGALLGSTTVTDAVDEFDRMTQTFVRQTV